MSGKEAATVDAQAAAAPPASILRPSDKSADPAMREVGDSSVDLDLLKVEAEIAKLQKQPTLEKIAEAYGSIRGKMEDNRRRRSGPLSPERLGEIDAEYAALEAKAEQLERTAWGMSGREKQSQFAINAGIAPGMRRDIPTQRQVPNEAEVQEKLAPLFERRKQLQATVAERRAKRKEQEAKRTQAPAGSTDARIAQAAATMGVTSRRPLTDFEVAIAQQPDVYAPTQGKGGRHYGRALRPIYSPTTGEPIFYLYESGGYTERFDIFGNYLGSGEIGLETPLIDPIDAILIAEGIGSLAYKGVSMGVRAVAAKAPRAGAKVMRNARGAVAAAQIGTAEAVPVIGRGAARGVGDTTLEIAGREGTAEATSLAGKGTGRNLGNAARGGGEIQLNLGDDAARAATEAVPSAAGATPTTAAAGQAAKQIAPKAPGDVAQALRQRFQGQLVDTGGALEQMITRARDPLLRQQGRGAASELQDVIRLLKNGEVDGKQISRVELIPSSSAGRTPDIRIHFADGTQTLWEVRSITSAPRNRVIPKPDGGPGAAARAAAERGQSRAVRANDLAQAIWSKAQNTATRPSQIAGGGTISVHVSAASISRAEVANGVQQITPRLGAHVERVEVTFLASRASPADPLTRDVMTFLRQPNGSYLLLP